MQLREGMYVRTEKGIAKYLGLGKDVLTINDKHYANQHLFDDYIFSVGHDWGDTLSNEEFKNIDKYIEKEPSYNPIDLIEVGDYVNGYKVKAVYLKGYRKYIKLSNAYENGKGIRTYSEDIKSIVTKELFNSVKYEVK